MEWFSISHSCNLWIKFYPLQFLVGMGNQDHVIMKHCNNMMTSSNGYIFRVTGHLCGEFTGTGEFPAQKPVTRTFDVFVDLRPNKRLSKQSWGWWFEMPSRPLWRHRNEYCTVLLLHNPRFKWLIYDDYNCIICCDFAIDDTMCVFPMWTEWENCFHIL